MTLETPLTPTKRGDSESRLFWRLLATFGLGFSLPVLACYGLVIVSALALRILALGSTSAATPAAESGVGPAVAVIPIKGIITSGEGGPFANTGVAFSESIIADIEKANEDNDVKAILLDVDSPGGGVVASDEIYHALSQVEKPVVVVIGGLGASGAYYISMASDWIIANPNSLVGSIGVISEFPNAEGLLEKVGVEFVVITSGPRKDVGSPYRDMTEAEEAYWQTIVDETYESFVQIVAEGRGMTVEDVAPLADGGVYTGRQALDLKLVDALGYKDDAITKAAGLGGITGEPRIIEYHKQPTLFELLTQAAQGRSLLPSAAELANLIGRPSLAARWVGP